MNELRIIGGQFRGRRLRFSPTTGLRPTLDVVRETLFNWLMFTLKDTRCLDAFAGSGALGIEALSRFAASVTFIENHKVAALTLKQNLAEFGLEAQAQVLVDSTLHFLAQAPVQAFDFIFLDPPFESGLLQEALSLIQARQWLAPQGLIYFEVERQYDLSAMMGAFALYRHKKLGDVQFGLMQLPNAL